MTYNNCMLYVSDVLNNYDIICTIDNENVFLNEPITMEEEYAIQKVKSGKAAGIDRICNEI